MGSYEAYRYLSMVHNVWPAWSQADLIVYMRWSAF